jgi:peroxiredoxin
MLAYRTASSEENVGLKIGQIFPNLSLTNSRNEGYIELHKLITQNTVIMVQPGASHQGQWDGKGDALEAWKAFTDPTGMSKCVAGCTGHLLGYLQQYFAYKNAGYNVIVIMSNKTPAELKSLEDEKGAAFPLYSLNDTSLAELKRLQHPVFKFEAAEYVYRNTWAVTPNMLITHSTNSVNHVADVSKNEAARFLGELIAPVEKLS